MPSVKIGPEFFSKEFNEYENWHWAWVREILQNSIDAGSNKIEFRFGLDENGDTSAIVVNDGKPMTEEILVDKLLALGSSGKNFSGSVGGFGKAKNIILFCHKSWDVKSGTTHAAGVGGEYELYEIPDFYGTQTEVLMSGNQIDRLRSAVRTFARFAQWSGVLLLDGDELVCDQQKGARRRDLGFGVVYTNKSDSNRLVVRIGGIPMFTQYCGHDRLVIVELVGRSDEVLTSNRDGLVSPYRGELSSFITELSVDSKSALRNNVPRYEHFAGRKLGHSRDSGMEVVDARALVDLGAVSGEVFGATDSDSDSGLDVVTSEFDSGDYCSPNPVGDVSLDVREGEHVRSAAFTQTEEVRRVVSLGSEFVLKNETNLVVPDYYRPDSPEFSEYSRKLIRVWGRLMVELHRLFDHAAEFGVGFVFEDGDVAAQHEKGDYGRVYYIAPAVVVEQNSSASKSFKKRWKLTDRNQLLSVAAHEFVHGLGYDWHCESYASKFTEVVGVVMDNRKRFNWCFK